MQSTGDHKAISFSLQVEVWPAVLLYCRQWLKCNRTRGNAIPHLQFMFPHLRLLQCWGKAHDHKQGAHTWMYCSCTSKIALQPLAVEDNDVTAHCIVFVYHLTLFSIKRNNHGDIIPPVVRQCVTFLREHGMYHWLVTHKCGLCVCHCQCCFSLSCGNFSNFTTWCIWAQRWID